MAPGDDVLAVTTDKEGAPRGQLLRWGLVPSWAKGPDTGLKMINARVETAAESPAFRRAFERYRCLIVADGFYEWQASGSRGTPKQPFHITRDDGSLFAFAGLWSIWYGARRDKLRSCTILTTAANTAIASLHDRMPVILVARARAGVARRLHPARGAGRAARRAPRLADRAAPRRPRGQRRPLRRPRVPDAPGPAGPGGVVLASRHCSRPLRHDDADSAPHLVRHRAARPRRLRVARRHHHPRRPEAIAELRAAGKHIAFVTNDARRSPEEYVRKLWSLGVQASLEEVVNAGGAIQHVLAERGPGNGTYVIGSPAVFRHVADAGHRIVNGTAGHRGRRGRGRWPREFRFEDLRDAIEAVIGGADIIASCRDRTFPTQDGLLPGTGAIVAALEYATGREAIDRRQARAADLPDRAGPPGSGAPLVVGDRIDADLAGADAAGLDGAIVLTGASSRAQAEAAADPAPVAIADDLHALLVAT